jgi:hypothetical protein
MKTYFMAAEIRNDYDNVVKRDNITFETKKDSSMTASEVFITMIDSIIKTNSCTKSNVFVTAFNSV